MIFWLACTNPAPALSEGDLTERVRQDVAARLSDHEVEVLGPLKLKLVGPGDHEATLHLESLVSPCEVEGPRCDEALVAYVDRQGRLSQARSDPLRFAALRPQLRSAEEARLRGLDHAPVAEGVVVVLTMSGEHSTRIVDATELLPHDTSFEEALGLALGQLDEPCLGLEGEEARWCREEGGWVRQ